MEITNISLNSILDMLRVLDSDNKRWLADHLYEDIRAEKRGSLVYPVIPKNRKPSRKVLENVAGSLPEGFDIDKETDQMWEEMATLSNPHDFEDEVQMHSAMSKHVDVLITRDGKGFDPSKVIVQTPAEFIANCMKS